MLYGQGAGAGATASAIVSDLTLTYLEGRHYAIPRMKGTAILSDFDSLPYRFYIALDKSSTGALPEGLVRLGEDENEVAYLTSSTTYKALTSALVDTKVSSILPILE